MTPLTHATPTDQLNRLSFGTTELILLHMSLRGLDVIHAGYRRHPWPSGFLFESHRWAVAKDAGDRDPLPERGRIVEVVGELAPQVHGSVFSIHIVGRLSHLKAPGDGNLLPKPACKILTRVPIRQ